MKVNKEFRPQPGKQIDFLTSSADIVFYVGTVGSGKSFSLFLESLRHLKVPKFGAVIFRREYAQLLNQGGFWEKSFDIYPYLGGKPNGKDLKWTFPIKGTRDKTSISMAGLQHDESVLKWDGTEIPLIMFDEVQHFSMYQFFYLLYRNRSTCGVRPYVRATAMVDPESWLKDFLSWWIGPDGYPDKTRSGVIRWMIRQKGNTVFWFDSYAEAKKAFPEKGDEPKSVTYIDADMSDNQILIEKDPGYIANVKAGLDYEKATLLEKNWNASRTTHSMFKERYWGYIKKSELPFIKEYVRYWDLAATEPEESKTAKVKGLSGVLVTDKKNNNDPDYTANTKMGIDRYNNVYIFSADQDRIESLDVLQWVGQTLKKDQNKFMTFFERDPAQAGKNQEDFYFREFPGAALIFIVKTKGKGKLSIWRPLAANAKKGKVFFVLDDEEENNAWIRTVIEQGKNVTDGTQKGHDDLIDVISGGAKALWDNYFNYDECDELDIYNLGNATHKWS